MSRDRRSGILRRLAASFAIVLVAGCAASPRTGTEETGRVSQSVRELIDQAVFEVVIKRPYDTPETRAQKIAEGRGDEINEDPFTYEEEIPWNLVNYTYRADEYLSVGTAFAISANQLLTAAHVLSLEESTLWDLYYIRDKDGQVYELDQVLKYANIENRDFAVFTVKGMDEMTHFSLEPDYELDAPVYTVGNALGEGVVIRDGLLTSTTEEPENGEWEHLRFSAAASPGNSGGPLLNDEGRVLGVVLMKSEGENLNYALPVSEVLEAEENTAVYSSSRNYWVVLSHRSHGPEQYTEKVELPLGYQELRSTLVDMQTAWNRRMLDELLKENRDSLLPYGKGSHSLFYQGSKLYTFPRLAMEEEDGGWGLFRPSEIDSGRLDNNGFVEYGTMNGIVFFRIRKPLDVSLQSLLDDSEFFNEMLLKGYPIYRHIGGDEYKVRYTSMGKAAEAYTLEDRFQRKWQVLSWNIVPADKKLIIYAMPTPSGFIAMGGLISVSFYDMEVFLDMQEYLNYVYFSYTGTFQEWEEYLALDFLTSPLLKEIQFSYSSGDKVSFENSKFRIGYGEEIFPIEDQSLLFLKAIYTLEADVPRWTPMHVGFSDNYVVDNYLGLLRVTKPKASLPEEDQLDWKKTVEGRFPYDGSPQPSDSGTYSHTLQRQFAERSADERDAGGLLYLLMLSLEGTKTDEDIEKTFAMLQEQTFIKE